jgi:hypothetical protein
VQRAQHGALSPTKALDRRERPNGRRERLCCFLWPARRPRRGTKGATRVGCRPQQAGRQWGGAIKGEPRLPHPPAALASPAPMEMPRRRSGEAWRSDQAATMAALPGR